MNAPVETPFLCVRCNRAVVVNQADYETFERMHWVCFHYAFEHGDDRDPDAACADGFCPSRQFDPKPISPAGPVSR